MCLEKTRPIKVTEPMNVYKYALKLTDGRYVSLKTAMLKLRKKDTEHYEYKNGENLPENRHFGIHSFKMLSLTKRFCKAIAACPVLPKDVESVVIFNAVIPEGTDTQMGYQNKHLKLSEGYMSYSLTIDTTPIAEYPIEVKKSCWEPIADFILFYGSKKRV